jgi:preprotein translocase subunit SecD
MTQSIKQRLIALGVVIVLAILLLVPTAFRDLVGEEWPFSRPISLGLDLSGGVHLVYEVMSEEAVKSNLQTSANSMRGLLRKEKIAVIRAKAISDRRLEVVLLTDVLAERARSVIDAEFKDLHFVEKGSDGERPKLVYEIPEARATEIQKAAVEQAIETLRNRVDQFGVAEPVIQRVGARRVLLQMPGVSDVEKVKKVVGSVAKLEFRLVPIGATAAGEPLKSRDGVDLRVEEQVMMTGDAVDDARLAISEGQVEVPLKLTSEGRRVFSQITTEHVGRSLAIILDDVVYSSPQIREPITGGMASISGGFTVEEAQQLSIVLRAGALPAPLQVVEERTVGPSLGRESIKSGVTAIIAGFVGILAFMAWYYRKAGFVAMGTLALNVVLILACLSFFGATLTLPGLAGVALTIGMAVDSNVIIFERIRDELRNGASRDAAVAGGFDKAWSAIIDTNVTGLVSGLILYMLGTGPIRGFAVTLCIGVITTMFCAVFVAKIAFDYFPLRNAKGLSI